LALSLVGVAVQFALAYADIGGTIANYLDVHDYKGKNDQINF
jgi:hypothetical protein